MVSRRNILKSIGISGGLVSISGCLDEYNEESTVDIGDLDSKPPIIENEKLLDYSLEELRNQQLSGGVGVDGIPSIDNPTFGNADEYQEDLFTDDIIFGVEINGVAKAYPRIILGHHEIVNDNFNGENVSITYCPLTGTPIGFKRDDVEFGVSGQLVNSNLIMWDRETETRWPQMLGVGMEGPLEGEFLDEFRVVWTSWDNWVSKYPDTEVLLTPDGFIRDYAAEDPYGTYQHRSGYYTFNGQPIFSPLREDNRFKNMEFVLGGRTEHDSFAVKFDYLEEEKVVSFDGSIAVYDEELDTGYMYNANVDVEWKDGLIIHNGTEYEPDNLPFDDIKSYRAKWFAWYGFYPNSQVKPI